MPQPALLVRLRPSGPWRVGPSDGALDRVDKLYRSDRLFSAVTIALRQLDMLEAWLDATARGDQPAVAFSSLFPFQGDALYVTPPASLWPPPSYLVTSPSPVFLSKVRWRAAQFVPLTVVDSLLTGQPILADQWVPDPDSGCLLRRDRPSTSPFRTVTRVSAPVDRLHVTAAEAEASACVEFESGSGLWSVVKFASGAAHETWSEPLKAAFRLLGDTGFGGGRSKGWGQIQTPEFESGIWPGLILPKVGRVAKDDLHEEQTSRSYWLMSLYSPAPQDTVNWSGGQYELQVRNGRVEGKSGALKKSVRMVVEGCVLDCASEPAGVAVNVAPENFEHPVYRSGIALALLIPPPRPASEDRRAIEEIVPPELEATPFPMPPTETKEPPAQTELAPEPEPLLLPPAEPEVDTEPKAETAAERETRQVSEPREAPVQEPEPERPVAPVEEPQAEPQPAAPEPDAEPIVEVVPEDVIKQEPAPDKGGEAEYEI